jgi:hypothetical protein
MVLSFPAQSARGIQYRGKNYFLKWFLFWNIFK